MPEISYSSPTTDHAASLAHGVVVMVINLELHSPYSTEVQDCLRAVLTDLRALSHASQASNWISVSFSGDEVLVEGSPQIGASLQAKRLLTLVADRGIRAIEFDGEGLDLNELLRFMTLLTSDNDRAAFATTQSIEAAFESRGIRGVRTHKGDTAKRGTGSADPSGATKPDDHSSPSLRGYQDLADCLHDSHVAASRGESLKLDLAAGVVEQALQQMDREPSGLLSLAYYDEIDSFTVGHSVRVALLTLQVARAAGADEATLLKAGTAALLHDIGKSRIPQSVLFKRGPLDDDEWRIMAMHPRLGAEILIEQPRIDPTAIGAAFCHHMAPGGLGYPRPAIAFEPSAISNLVRVADVFEALTSIRPYKPALSPVEAYAIMHRKPEDFDPTWLQFFVDALGLYPLGTRLELTTGEFAMVIGHGPHRDRPRVRILHDVNGKPIAEGQDHVATIGDLLEGQTRDIAAVVPRARPGAARVMHDHDPSGETPCC